MTGPLKLVDGTASAPALAFNSASGTGIYKTTNGWGIAVGGVQAAEFTSDGLISANPVGAMQAWPLLAAPSGWLFCTGQAVSRTTYAKLWSLASADITAGGTVFGVGDGSTTFTLPDIGGRVIAGKEASATRLTSAGSGVDGATLGATGGSETHVLTKAEAPSGLIESAIVDPGHHHTLSATAVTSDAARNTNVAFSSATGINTSSAETGITITTTDHGSDDAHNNVQPTIVLNYIIFAGA